MRRQFSADLRRYGELPSSTQTALGVLLISVFAIKAALSERGWGLDWILLTHHHWDHVDGVAERFEAWFAASGFSGAVWTDLPGNFHEETGTPYSLTAALAYLQGLEGRSLLEAKRYIELAPEETMTSLRKTLAGEAWWADVPLHHELDEAS